MFALNNEFLYKFSHIFSEESIKSRGDFESFLRQFSNHFDILNRRDTSYYISQLQLEENQKQWFTERRLDFYTRLIKNFSLAYPNMYQSPAIRKICAKTFAFGLRNEDHVDHLCRFHYDLIYQTAETKKLVEIVILQN